LTDVLQEDFDAIADCTRAETVLKAYAKAK